MSEAKSIDLFVQKQHQLRTEVAKVIIGQDDVVELLVNAIFSKGHALLVGVPGLAKTLLINTISDALGLSFKRIQFTPDLMPSDIVGSEVLGENREFRFIKGPIFANIILADEINRTPPKTQSALLEAMQEKAVTAAGHRYKLDEPFFVLATQNPIEQEGTYPLPEAQLDRFMYNIWVDYPSYEEEVQVVKRTTGEMSGKVEPILDHKEILFFQDLLRKIPVTDNVVEYAVGLVAKTRPGTKRSMEVVEKYITWGAGPRASQYLILGAKTHAAMHGKYSPDISDVQAVATSVLRHRLVRNYKAEAEGYSIERIVAEML
ncbi:MAG: AAA family ATPase [Bacteroidetes bacterium]|nr:AAA family ATPase [Bacteroidota bacterium]